MGTTHSQFGVTKTFYTSVYKTQNENSDQIFKTRYGYYENQKDVFYDGLSLNLSPTEKESFKKLKYSYAKSKNFVFYEGRVIPNADPKTFIVINRKSMPEEFKTLNSVIGMDIYNREKHIYQFGKLIFTISLK